MAPRRRPREGVAEQATRQEVGDAPPPQQTQPLPQDAHSGIVPPPPPPPQTQVVPSQPRHQQGSVQTTPRTATSYTSTSTGTTGKLGSRRKFRRDRRQAEQRQQ
ncbi:hypothetical protein Taro_005798, partial [Colocasia esculenta]|nr:hypothetical protein [Colocasia esculenta]